MYSRKRRRDLVVLTKQPRCPFAVSFASIDILPPSPVCGAVDTICSDCARGINRIFRNRKHLFTGNCLTVGRNLRRCGHNSLRCFGLPDTWLLGLLHGCCTAGCWLLTIQAAKLRCTSLLQSLLHPHSLCFPELVLHGTFHRTFLGSLLCRLSLGLRRLSFLFSLSFPTLSTLHSLGRSRWLSPSGLTLFFIRGKVTLKILFGHETWFFWDFVLGIQHHSWTFEILGKRSLGQSFRAPRFTCEINLWLRVLTSLRWMHRASSGRK